MPRMARGLSLSDRMLLHFPTEVGACANCRWVLCCGNNIACCGLLNVSYLLDNPVGDHFSNNKFSNRTDGLVQ
jgi:hypothetical protein